MYPLWRTANFRRRRDEEYLDRFIPNRHAMNFGYAHAMLTGRGVITNQSSSVELPQQIAYRRELSQATGIFEGGRILAYNNRPQLPVGIQRPMPFRNVAERAERVFPAPDMVDDFSLNLLDWSTKNLICIALGNTLVLGNYVSDVLAVEDLVTVDDQLGPITSVSWAPDGLHLAIGLSDSSVQYWDSSASHPLRTFSCEGGGKTCSLAWNDDNILTTGGANGRILNNDVRMASHSVGRYGRGHRSEVCGLKWSAQRPRQLASGGKDNSVYIWDRSVSSSSSTPWLCKLEHRAAVRALAWCPFRANILASGGGGTADSCIRMWNASSGVCLNNLNTGSEVCALLWNQNRNYPELLSSHGSPWNHLALWKYEYPSMSLMAELSGHTSRPLFMAAAPDGCTVASAAVDETLRIWNVFQAEQPRRVNEPFAHGAPWLCKLEHRAAVRALAWCPFRANILASGGGGTADSCIRMWNASSGVCLNNLNTGSEVCALLWNQNRNYPELLSSHGSPWNHLALWKYEYPSMSLMAELSGHTSRPLFMAAAPDGCTVASAAVDETLRIWNVFQAEQPRRVNEPFAHSYRSTIR